MRIPPQSIEVEQKVLGAMLQSQSAAGSAMEVLRTGSFYKQIHTNIYEAMLELFNKNEPIDIITVSNRLKQGKKLEAVGGEIYLMRLIEVAITPSNIVYHANIIKEKSTIRKLITASTSIIDNCFDEADDVDKLLDQSESTIFEISQGRTKKDFRSIETILPNTFKDFESYGKNENKGVQSGFTELDNMTSGFQGGELIVLAGRPAMGKTALALSIATNASVMLIM